VILDLNPEVDADRLRKAVQMVVDRVAVLRTRTVCLQAAELVQVVAKSHIQWRHEHDLKAYLAEVMDLPWGLGEPLVQYALVEQQGSSSRSFICTIHHAIYDGWSFANLTRYITQAYLGILRSVGPEYTIFIQHIASTRQLVAEQYWQQELAGLQASAFPALQSISYVPQARQSLVRDCPPLPRVDGIPRSVILRAALAIVLSKHTGSSEVCFGSLVSGRYKSIPEISDLLGNTVATVPLRISARDDQRIEAYLSVLKQQALDMVPFEQWGLHNISHVSEEGHQACAFQTLLSVQPAEDVFTAHTPVGVWRRQETDDGSVNYALSIQCFLNKDCIRMKATFDNHVVTAWAAGKLLEQLAHATHQLVLHRNKTLQELQLASTEDLHDIWTWNANVPPTNDVCVHDLIASTVNDRPEATAICAWDGELTYAQLDELSSRAATKLSRHGVGPEVVVPLLFEKSKWTAVAMLAVMKCGGASSLLDAMLPEERLHGILLQLGSHVIVCSKENTAWCQNLDNVSVVVISAGSLDDAESEFALRHHPKPSNALYIVWTSGSTGMPKGVVITHRNFSSSVFAQANAFKMTRESRVYDFVSYAFDVAWLNFIITLCVGACLCIPSETDRRDDLAGSLTRLRATWVYLTPSILRSLRPDELPTLKTIRVGGEPLIARDISNFAVKADVVGSYGPAECTVTATSAGPIESWQTDLFLGGGLVTNAWLVNGDQLSPVGAVGEIWLEGPLVGREYYKDPQRTAMAFVQDPPWLLHGYRRRLGRTGRLYRTGDLARYNSDGSLTFVGRADRQVKIRGQRVNLAEVERVVRAALLKTSVIETVDGDALDVCVVAEIIQPIGPAQDVLVAFISLGGDDTLDSDTHKAAVEQAAEILDNLLAAEVPQYMIPAAYIPVQVLPIAATGKVDHRRLQQIGVAWYQSATSTSRVDTIESAVDSLTKQLVEVWAEILGLDESQVSIDSPFIRLGGDSITAMQAVSRLRARNISITVSDVLEERTIRRIAHRCEMLAHTTLPIDHQEVSGAWSLSPIQRLFFRRHPRGLNHYNQSFLLRLAVPSPISPQAMKNALNALVERHAMLRARFRRTLDAGWEQFCEQDDVPGAYAFSHHEISNMADAFAIMESRHASLDISHGPVFAADLLSTSSEGQFLSLIAHHLVIDLVSWRIIWHDVSQMLAGSEHLANPPVSFQAWCRLQQDASHALTPVDVVDGPICLPSAEYWNLAPEDNLHGGAIILERLLDPQTTEAILAISKYSLGAGPTEVLLAGLLQSFQLTFPDRELPGTFVEGHGREPLNNVSIDLSETIGWFTAMSPLQLKAMNSSSFQEFVSAIKTARKNVRGNGVPYFAARAYNEQCHDAFASHEIIEMLFNFAGTYRQLEGSQSLFQTAHCKGATNPSNISPSARRSAFIEINVFVHGQQMRVDFRFHRHMKHMDRLRAWVGRFTDGIRQGIQHLLSSGLVFCASDFPLLSLADDNVDADVKAMLKSVCIEPGAVEDIYPCMPLQEGILLAVHRDVATYSIRWVWQCELPSSSGGIDIHRLAAAWDLVARRHSVFATTFAQLPGTGRFVQILLRDPPRRVRVEDIVSTDALQLASTEEPPVFSAGQPAHEFTIYRSSRGQVLCRLDISHALIDAASLPMLVAELATAYHGELTAKVPALREVITHWRRVEIVPSIDYWADILSGANTCHLPRSRSVCKPPNGATSAYRSIKLPATLTSSITEYCRAIDITRAVFFQVVWAMVLSFHTGLHDVCFGYLVSGRDIPIEGVDRIIAPLISLLINRTDLDGPLDSVLEDVSKRSVEHLKKQQVSLAELQHHIGSNEKLFNTAVSVREARQDTVSQHNINLRLVKNDDPDEVCFILS
jgi:amino acid adenylation domain-containing protein